MQDPLDNDPREYPSLDLAYEYIIPLHDWAMRRLESAERRIDNLITFVIAFTSAFGAGVIAIMGLFKIVPNLFQTYAVVGAIILFILTLGIGIYTRQMGSVPLFDLKDLHSKRITEPPEQFRKSALYSAGNNIAAITSLVEKKTKFANVMLLLFLIEVIGAAIWVCWSVSPWSLGS